MPKHEFSRPLGDAVKLAREAKQLSQSDLALSIDADQRTILNIENYRGNPKMEIIYPLIRELDIDPNTIFYPKKSVDGPEQTRLQHLLLDCSEEEARMLYPVCLTLLNAYRQKDAASIE